MKALATLLILFQLSIGVSSQDSKLWTEADRQYLLQNLTRSRDELVKETQDLTKAQWEFKESPDRWSINEVVEHLAIYELLFQRLIAQSLASKPQPELNASAKHDSTYFNFIMETKVHITNEYTKPFTFAQPMGLNDLKNNVSWFLKMRNESIGFVKTTQEDLRTYYLTPDRPNVHQIYIWTFGHVDRALRQIKKVKADVKYLRR